MDGIKSIEKPRISPGDLAVDGIFIGMEAGIVMAVFLAAVAAQNHISPAELLSTFSFMSSPDRMSGLLTHLAVSSIYGIFFSIGTYFIFRRSSKLKVSFFVPFSGLIYGSLLWIAAEFYLFNFFVLQLENLPANILLAAHLIFGLTLGFLIQRRRRSTFS